MRVQRVLCEGPGDASRGDIVALPGDKVRHLREVLRLRDGAPLEITDGAGATAPAALVPGGAELCGEWVAVPRPSPVHLHPCVSKGRKLDFVVEKATELGVEEITPVISARTERRWDAEAVARRLERWRSISHAALEQSHGAWLPRVGVPVDFADLVARERGLLLDPSGSAAEWGSDLAMRLLVGPEGGFSDREKAEAEARGWGLGRLGPTVLRTETAAVVGVALAAFGHAEWIRAGRDGQD